MRITYLVPFISVLLMCGARADEQGIIFLGGGADAPQYSQLLIKEPYSLHRLLGVHISEAVPGADLSRLPSPEEYKNPNIKYGVFVRGSELKRLILNWEFVIGDLCVSEYSLFLLFFNRGTVFRVELRLVPDSFTGRLVESELACEDHSPVFNAIARRVGGSAADVGERKRLVDITEEYRMELILDDGVVNWVWDLRGGPSLPRY